MTIYRVQTSLQSDSNLPRDQFVSSLYIEDNGVLPPFYFSWTDAIWAYYQALNGLLSPVIAQDGHTLKVYQVGAPLESPPVASIVKGFTTAPSGTALPNEVASVLTFHGPLHAGWERQSVYGRIYLGPFNTTASSTIAGGGAIPSGTLQGEAVPKAQTLATAINAVGAKWVVYSKVHNAATVVTAASMDNEWDTVRSRGYRATSKLQIAVTQT